MRTHIGLAIFCSFFSASLMAQDSTKKAQIQFSGGADMYYRYDFNNPKLPYNNFTSFTNSQNSFELGSVSLKAEHSIGKVGMVADVAFGKRADEFSYNDTKSSVAIRQLYISYNPTAKLKLTMGSWATHIGYESVDAFANRNYSMSYLFSYGPFFHTGLKAAYQISSQTTAMLGIANPFDLKYASNLPKMVIGQIATTSRDQSFKISLSYQGGKNTDSNRLYQGDVVVNYTISPKFSIGYNGTIQSRQQKTSEKWETGKTWSGNALYLVSTLRSWLAFCLRGELLNDQNDVLGFDGNVFETTFSTNFIFDNLTLIPEVRFESAGQKIYANHIGNMMDHTANFLFAAVYKF